MIIAMHHASPAAAAEALTDGATAKGTDIKATGLKDALGTIHKILSVRNQLVHDAIGFHRNTGKWVRGKGTPNGDSAFGKTAEISPTELRELNEKAW